LESGQGKWEKLGGNHNQFLQAPREQTLIELEYGPVPIVMAALPNTGGALCSTLQSLADAHYWSAMQ